MVRKDDGSLLRGISRNQICIAAAADSRRVFCKTTGNGKPSSEKILSVFKDHIKRRSTLIHDGEHAHEALVDTLKLKEEVYLSDETKGMDDLENPLDRINNVHSLLKWFLESHSSFLRKNLDGFINLFVFIMNPPHNRLEKVELFLEMAIKTRVSLRYRDFYKKKPQ